MVILVYFEADIRHFGRAPLRRMKILGLAAVIL